MSSLTEIEQLLLLLERVAVPQEVPDYSSIDELKDIPLIIPSETYHPEVKVVIDFKSKFTLDFISETDDIEGSRLVEPDILLRNALTLCNFWGYYFNNAFLPDMVNDSLQGMDDKSKSFVSSNNAKTYDFFKRIFQEISAKNEETATQFINYIINYFITDIQVQRNIGDIGTCTITFRDNFCSLGSDRQSSGSQDTLFFTGQHTILNQLFSPMLPISVWAKGRIVPDQWFPIFNGYIFQFIPACQEGFTTFTLQCRDALELARISSENINPAIIQYRQIKKQNSLQMYSQAFYNQSLTQIVKIMFLGGSAQESFEQTALDLSLQDFNPQKDNVRWASEGSISFAQLGDYRVYSSSATSGYNSEHDNPKFFAGDLSDTSTTFLEELRKRRKVLLWGENITPYKIFNMASPKSLSSQFTTRYDVLRNAALHTYFDFYADAYGNIRFHPKKFANKFFKYDAIYVDPGRDQINIEKQYPSIYIVSPHETTRTNSVFNIQNLITYLRLGGTFPTMQKGEENSILTNSMGIVADTILMKKYGFRMGEIYDEVFNFNPPIKTGSGKTFRFLDFCARELLKYKNGELYTRTTDIIFRPELELANPIFFTDTNQVFYIQSISHNITIGQTATTTVNCNFGRHEKEDPQMLFDFLIANQKIYEYETKGGSKPDMSNLAASFEEQANRYIFPFTEAERQIEKAATEATKDPPAGKSSSKKKKAQTATDNKK